MYSHEGVSTYTCLEFRGLKDVFDSRVLIDNGSKITSFRKASGFSTFNICNAWGDIDGFDSLSWTLAPRDIALEFGLWETSPVLNCMRSVFAAPTSYIVIMESAPSLRKLSVALIVLASI